MSMTHRPPTVRNPYNIRRRPVVFRIANSPRISLWASGGTFRRRQLPRPLGPAISSSGREVTDMHMMGRRHVGSRHKTEKRALGSAQNAHGAPTAADGHQQTSRAASEAPDGAPAGDRRNRQNERDAQRTVEWADNCQILGGGRSDGRIGAKPDCSRHREALPQRGRSLRRPAYRRRSRRRRCAGPVVLPGADVGTDHRQHARSEA